MKSSKDMPSLWESWGLLPFRRSLPQAKIALLGAPDLPPSKMGLSSLVQLQPSIGIPLWRGKFVVPRTVLVSNLFNHRQTPVSHGWSTRRTMVEDFRGKGSTYDSHNGTDFCIPRGTTVVSPASGRVGRIFSEFNRGGLKVAIDHGNGVMTLCAHMARVVVAEGERVDAGEVIGLSGYSGLDGFATFPWGIPHVHFNVWLNGHPVDPFARGPEKSLWRSGAPVPVPLQVDEDAFEDSEYDREAVDALIESCVTPHIRSELRKIEPLYRRAAYAISSCNYYPTRFERGPDVYRSKRARAESIWIPFSERDVDGCRFLDELIPAFGRIPKK